MKTNKSLPKDLEVVQEVELSALDLRYEDFRVKQVASERLLLSSIAQMGIEDALDGVEEDGILILLNGFKRYRCACKLGLASVPYRSLGLDAVSGILGLLRMANERGLSLLEQAAFLDEFKAKSDPGLSVAQMADKLSRSKAWVCVRLGLLKELGEKVRKKLFSGAFPVYSYMYTLRAFRRMNAVSSKQIEEFVLAVSGKGLSVREIEQLANGYFRGTESFRQEIIGGHVSLALEQIKKISMGGDECSEFERCFLNDMELTGKYMARVMGKSEYPRLKSRSFHAQSHLLTLGILNRAKAFTQTIRRLHDRNGQT